MGRPKRSVVAAADESTTPPDELTAAQYVARVVQFEGSNLYTCELPSSDKNPRKVLVELPARFQKTIWIKRGGFVLVDLALNDERKPGSRVEGDIINVVRDERIWRKQKYWPPEFPRHTQDEEDDEDSNVGKLPPSDSEED